MRFGLVAQRCKAAHWNTHGQTYRFNIRSTRSLTTSQAVASDHVGSNAAASRRPKTEESHPDHNKKLRPGQARRTTCELVQDVDQVAVLELLRNEKVALDQRLDSVVLRVHVKLDGVSQGSALQFGDLRETKRATTTSSGQAQRVLGVRDLR